MTKSQIFFSGGWRRGGRGGGKVGRGLLTYFPTFVPEFKNDKIRGGHLKLQCGDASFSFDLIFGSQVIAIWLLLIYYFSSVW